jgi:hypothetical protein
LYLEPIEQPVKYKNYTSELEEQLDTSVRRINVFNGLYNSKIPFYSKEFYRMENMEAKLRHMAHDS